MIDKKMVSQDKYEDKKTNTKKNKTKRGINKTPNPNIHKDKRVTKRINEDR